MAETERSFDNDGEYRWWEDAEGRAHHDRTMALRRARTTPGQLCECGAIITQLIRRSHDYPAINRLVTVVAYQPGLGVRVRAVDDGREFVVARQDLHPVTKGKGGRTRRLTADPRSTWGPGKLSCGETMNDER